MKSKLKNPKNTITASEINKFVYCPYQWYYERLYGIKELRRRYKEFNEEYGHLDPIKSNFVKGIRFHERFGQHETPFRTFLAVLLIIIILTAVFAYIYFFYGH